jgi:hypothetical protein
LQTHNADIQELSRLKDACAFGPGTFCTRPKWRDNAETFRSLSESSWKDLDAGGSREGGIPMNNEDILFYLEGAVDNLVYVSRIESPLTVFIWPGAELPDGINVITLRVYRDIPEGIPIEILGADMFFRPMIETSDPRYTPFTSHFKELLDFLKANLADLTVYKVGYTDIEAYVVGRTPEGDYAGVQARVREA